MCNSSLLSLQKNLLPAIGFISFLFIIGPVWGEGGIKTATDLTLTVSSRPEIKLGLSQSVVVPFLQGTGPLTADNNIKAVLTAEVSPISLNVLTNVTWTPIAFFQLAAGCKAGSGWNVNLFSSDIYGIGINRRSDDGAGKISGSAFEGCYWGANIGGALQGDVAALFPGDWNHLVFRTYHEINYRGFSSASDEESWVFENDFGENRNGCNYYGNYLIGYQMPLFLNMAGLMAEMTAYLYDTPNRTAWGDELGFWVFSALANCTVTEWFGTALIVQCRTRRNYDDENRFYQDRILDTSNPIGLEFYRVAVLMHFKIR